MACTHLHHNHPHPKSLTFRVARSQKMKMSDWHFLKMGPIKMPNAPGHKDAKKYQISGAQRGQKNAKFQEPINMLVFCLY